MSEDLIVRQASPTLAGMKTGSLFGCAYADKDELRADVCAWNRRLVPLGLCLLPLCFTGKRALLYLYRPDALKKDLKDGRVRAILKKAGYRSESSTRCITELMRRLRTDADFPHEIGLFLSYPPEDVQGFIENGASNYKLVGTWKVYGDAEKARETFRRYRDCTENYRARHQAGSTIEQLAV